MTPLLAVALAAALAQWLVAGVPAALALAAVLGGAAACSLAVPVSTLGPGRGMAAVVVSTAAAVLGLLAWRSPRTRDAAPSFTVVAAAGVAGLLLAAAFGSGRSGLAPFALLVVAAAPLAWRRDPRAHAASLCALGFAAVLAAAPRDAAWLPLLAGVLLGPALWLARA